MATVDAEIEFQGNDDQYFIDHATDVPGVGVQIFHTDGRYKFGDNVTQLQNLPFRGAGGGVQSVTGSGVDNTDPFNPVVNTPNLENVLGVNNKTGNISIQSPTTKAELDIFDSFAQISFGLLADKYVYIDDNLSEFTHTVLNEFNAPDNNINGNLLVKSPTDKTRITASDSSISSSYDNGATSSFVSVDDQKASMGASDGTDGGNIRAKITENLLIHSIKNTLTAPVNEVSQDPATPLGIVTKQLLESYSLGIGATAGGDLSGTYPNPTVLNSAVLAKVLTGLNITGSSITSADTVLQAFGKLQNEINGVLGGAIYQGVWNAATNSPTLSDGTGVKGYYYVVSVAGSINLGSGSIDFQVGDWAIHNGTIYQKVDNTDAVSSVNGFIGAVNLTTANISEVTNLYFTAARVLATLLTGYTSGAGTITSSDTILQAIQKLNGNIGTKQDTLVSATNIKTVGGVSVLGSGDVATPIFTNPIVGTQAANDNSTKAASTAYVDAKVTQTITNGVTDKAPSEDAVFDAISTINTSKGFSLPITFSTSNPADATVYYIGQISGGLITSVSGRYVMIPRGGTVTDLSMMFYVASTIPSGENNRFDLELYSTSGVLLSTTLLSTTIPFSTSPVRETFVTFTGINLVVAQGESLVIKMTTATYATNPMSIHMSGNIFVK